MDFRRLRRELFGERQHGGFVRRERAVQAQHRALVAAFQFFFVVCVAQKRQCHAVCAQRGLHAIGDVLPAGERILVFKVFAAVLRVGFEVEVRAVGNAPQLAPAEREQEFDVCRALAVVRKLGLFVLAQLDVRLSHAEREQEVFAVVLPVGVPFEVGAGLAEELQLHLLKLARAEREVAGRDLVAKRFADLRDAERDLAARGALHVAEVDEDALGGFRAQVQLGGRVFRNALEGLKHQVELTDAGKVGLAAFRADDAVVGDELLHLLVAPAVRTDVQAVFFRIGFDQLVGAEARLAGLAVHQRVGKTAHVAAGHPGFGVHEDGGVHAHVVGAFLHKLAPPGLFDVVFKFHAQRAVVPGVGKAAVNFAARKDKAAALAQRHDLIHRFCNCHNDSLLLKFPPIYY